MMSAAANHMATRTALLLGASGLIGGHCLDLLLADEFYSRVVAPGRRPLARAHAKLTQHAVNFDDLAAHAALLRADDVFCCLGTTIKRAGSQEAFRKVDFTYPAECARLARREGAQQFLLVSSLGANARSAVFYSRVKGEVEAAIAAVGFEAVQIFRPSLLTGERAERRTGEVVAGKFADVFSFAFAGPLRKYRPIAARAVAAAMVNLAKRRPPGVNIYESDRIRELAV
jgi:uncharacterized protein YbjT (DUF2867 family)